MNILAIGGSPRLRGNSNGLLREAVAGGRSVGHSVKILYARRLRVQPCTGCYACKRGIVCVVDDDMRFVYEGLRAADALLLATPVYYYTMSGWLKAVVDRTFALIDNDYQSRIPRGKLLFVVTTQEEADRQDGEAVVRTLERAFSWIGMKLAGSLVCTGLFAERDYQGHPELLLAARDLLVANEKTLDGRRRRR